MIQTRTQWEARRAAGDAQCGNDGWNRDAKYWQAFRDSRVVAVVREHFPGTGLWTEVDVLLTDGRTVRRHLNF